MLISKEFRFEASHVLPAHPGKCARLHGHSYLLTVSLVGYVNGRTGFVMDYGEMSDLLNPLVDLFDHHHLNDVMEYPSAENLATLFGGILSPLLAANYRTTFTGIIVELCETSKTKARWEAHNSPDCLSGMSMLARARERWNDLIRSAARLEVVDNVTPASDCTVNSLPNVYQDYVLRLRDAVNVLQNKLIDLVCEGGAYHRAFKMVSAPQTDENSEH